MSSKSGSTLEPNIFKQYFFERTKQAVGAAKVGQPFYGRSLIRDRRCSRSQRPINSCIFFSGVPSIGGRYSALSNFGMVPAAVMGMDTKKFLDRAHEMVRACGGWRCRRGESRRSVGSDSRDGRDAGRDKVTIVASPGDFRSRRVARTTAGRVHGKDRQGNHSRGPRKFGCAGGLRQRSRLCLRAPRESAPDADQDAKVAAIEKAGHPVVRISMADIYELGAEFFRWEIATAVAGSIIGINAFNQPDVEASKIATRNLTSEYEKTGSLPPEKPVVEDSGIKLIHR